MCGDLDIGHPHRERAPEGHSPDYGDAFESGGRSSELA